MANDFVITSMEDTKDYQNVLIYGDYGSGKTHLAATATEVPEMQEVLYVSVEGGEKTLKKWPKMDVIRINTYSQMARVYEFIRLHCIARDKGDIETLKKLEAKFRGIPQDKMAEYYSTRQPKQYGTVVLDSLTELHKLCMYQLLGIKIGEFTLDMEPDNPQFAEWGKSSEMIKLLVRTFRDLPINVVMIAAKATEQDEKKQYHHMPMLPGKLASEVQGFFDTVMFLVTAPNEATGQIARRGFLTPGKTHQAKNRYRNFDKAFIDNPSMADLAKLEVG